MGWLHDFDFSELIRLCEMDRDLSSRGFEIHSPNGLLAKVGIAQANEGHLVPHEAMPDGFDSGTISIPTNAHLGLRAAHHRRWDVRSIATPDNGYAVVRRKADTEISRDASSRIQVCHEGTRRLKWFSHRVAMLRKRWRQALRSRCAGGGFKPPTAAAFKRRGGERAGKRQDLILSGMDRGVERK